MSYYPPPNQAQDYSVSYYPSHNQGQVGFNAPYGNEPFGQYGRPAPFPTEQYGPPGSYPPPGQYLPPGQYPPPEQYPPPSQPYAQEYGQGGYGGDPIVNQPIPPIGGDWMTMSQGPPKCPPGLEYLMSLSSLFVKQKVEFLEALTGYETKNKYTVTNDKGQKIYWVAEESGFCARLCCGRLRPFEMTIVDAQQREVMRIHRLFRCTLCCFPCCLQIYSEDGKTEVGKISKNWSGFARELFTDADFFGITFPLDLDVRMKAVMLGAIFLLVSLI